MQFINYWASLIAVIIGGVSILIGIGFILWGSLASKQHHHSSRTLAIHFGGLVIVGGTGISGLILGGLGDLATAITIINGPP